MEKIMLDKPKILIVDDEPLMCQCLMELLAGKNYELNTANSAKEAIEFRERGQIFEIDK
jgi:CheY-like chemotaxis protein